jgi:hypothetical protein
VIQWPAKEVRKNRDDIGLHEADPKTTAKNLFLRVP